MLVLSRKPQQVIHVGDDIAIQVLSIRGGAVRIGIDAPRGVRVVREELLPPPATVPRPTCRPDGAAGSGH